MYLLWDLYFQMKKYSEQKQAIWYNGVIPGRLG